MAKNQESVGSHLSRCCPRNRDLTGICRRAKYADKIRGVRVLEIPAAEHRSSRPDHRNNSTLGLSHGVDINCRCPPAFEL